MAMVKATFFLPVRDNDGRSLRAEIRVLEDALFARFPGYTRMASVFGVFRMADGTKVKDRCRSYFLWLDEVELEVLKGIIRTLNPRRRRRRFTSTCCTLPPSISSARGRAWPTEKASKMRSAGWSPP